MSSTRTEPRPGPRPPGSTPSAATSAGALSVASLSAGRRSTPQVLLGVLLVVVCALGFAVVALRVDPRVEVLATARPVAAGQVLRDGDVMVARIVPDDAVPVVSAADRGSVVGRTLVLPLAAGSLLSQRVLGPSSWPPAQQSVVAVSVKPALMPAGLVAGSRVTVIVAASGAGAATGPLTATAGGQTAAHASGVVVQVTTAAAGLGGQQASTSPVSVSLLLPAEDALRVATATGDAVLVLQGRPGTGNTAPGTGG